VSIEENALMHWKEFLKTAYPNYMELQEAEKSIVWKVNRWLGLRFAYIFYHFGFSANLLSVFRCFLALIGFYLISLVEVGNKWAPILGVLILAWQINLDYADGSIARAQGKSSEFGEKMDGMANACSRIIVLILAGFLTSNSIIFLISSFSAYVLVVFIPFSKLRIKKLGRLRLVAWIYQALLYVPVMVLLLPLVFGLHGVLGLEVVTFSYIVVYTYSVLAVLWLLLLLWHAGRGESPLEDMGEHA
jgi:phosphatidylglycerophosphate synthase